MAVATTNITKGGSSTGATSYATASISPPSNKLILAVFVSRTAISTDPTEPTCSGCGLTWVKVNTVVYDNTSSSRKRLTVFRALGTPTTGAVTFDEAGQSQTHAEWVIDYFDNADTTGTNGSGAIVQSVTNFDGSASAATITGTLAAFGSTDNATYGAFGDGNGNTWTAGSGFTITAQDNASTAVNAMSEFKATNDTTVDATDGVNSELGVIAIEIAAAIVVGTTGTGTLGYKSLLGIGR